MLAGVFALRFRALVDDPVPTMATTTLPLTAALQVAYAVWCLPAPGAGGPGASGGTGAGAGGGGAIGAAGAAGGAKAAGRKPRPGETSLRKRAAAESGKSSAVIVRFTLISVSYHLIDWAPTLNIGDDDGVLTSGLILFSPCRPPSSL